VVGVVFVFGCTAPGVETGGGDEPRELPDGVLDVATWNIENFPKADDTPERVASLIQSLDLDLVALEEIASEEAFFRLLAALPGYRGVLSTHAYFDDSYQKLAFLYRASALAAGESRLLFEDDGGPFPRPPLEVRFRAPGNFDFVAIALHLKAGIGDDDRDRRREAIARLAEHADDLVHTVDSDIVMLGDYNEVVTSEAGQSAFAAIRDRADDFVIATEAIAQKGSYSFVPSGKLIDHVVLTTTLAQEVVGGTHVPALDHMLSNYEDTVSDHLPVIVPLRAQP
jgi:endonuclease/exonuclease/phosphatase family metal-dependent hydrolase